MSGDRTANRPRMRHWGFPNDAPSRQGRRVGWMAIAEPDERVIAAGLVLAVVTGLAAWMLYAPVMRLVRPAPTLTG